MKYPYRYKHFDNPIKTQFGRYVCGTDIYATKQICIDLLHAYSAKTGIKNLSGTGINFYQKGRKCGIIIRHPKDSPTLEEAKSFQHREIAHDITKAWRDIYGRGDNQAHEADV